MPKLKSNKTKLPKQLHDVVSKTKVVAHDLSVLKPATHKPTNQLGDSTTEQRAIDFVFGFNFPDGVNTTGKRTHDDYGKTFGK